ncbi:MAG: hypothetical protein GY801_48070 [bacterium]|nr:hypothetical protein [bacterium]
MTFGQPGCQDVAKPRLSSEASHQVLMTFWGSYSGYDPNDMPVLDVMLALSPQT